MEQHPGTRESTVGTSDDHDPWLPLKLPKPCSIAIFSHKFVRSYTLVRLTWKNAVEVRRHFLGRSVCKDQCLRSDLDGVGFVLRHVHLLGVWVYLDLVFGFLNLRADLPVRKHLNRESFRFAPENTLLELLIYPVENMVAQVVEEMTNPNEWHHIVTHLAKLVGQIRLGQLFELRKDVVGTSGDFSTPFVLIHGPQKLVRSCV